MSLRTESLEVQLITVVSSKLLKDLGRRHIDAFHGVLRSAIGPRQHLYDCQLEQNCLSASRWGWKVFSKAVITVSDYEPLATWGPVSKRAQRRIRGRTRFSLELMSCLI